MITLCSTIGNSSSPWKNIFWSINAQKEIKANSYDFSERLIKLFLAKICKANSCLTEGKKTSREKGGGHLAGGGVGWSGAIQRPQKYKKQGRLEESPMSSLLRNGWYSASGYRIFIIQPLPQSVETDCRINLEYYS
jgi:hypothetical protein